MAFDQATRNRLQRFVNEARKALEEEFTRQLQLDYGLDPASGTVTPMENLRHLTDAQRETARILRDTLAHYCASPGTDAASGLDRIVREQAFTILNRLAALRMAEARGLLIESVGNGYQAKGFQLYSRLAGPGLGETGDAYRTYLLSVFDELSQDLPTLFDRYSPQGRLFPRETALVQILSLINHGEIEPLWAEDETIGWIYQYFNSKEERKAMRDASQAPRNSRELAVRNQFFTPRYVVEFLVDNTLGRLWFNWMGGQTTLRDRCQYLLVKPEEQHEATKRLRDPRTITLLDPACGSMHFGLYAFDLFEEIYSEAWVWEQTHGPAALDRDAGGSPHLKPLSESYSDRDAFLRDVPRLIIEHNIYGVDIDPRAAQIASLALWLRAQRTWHETGVRAKDRPQVGQGHVVAAVAPPAEVDLRKRFMEELDPQDAELFEQTLFMLKGLPELGVLLQVEKELPALIRKVFGEHGALFRNEDMAQWQNAEARLRIALTEFERTAQSTYRRRLFAHDALQGLRLLDLIREKFDVVVMNPPFGAASEGSKQYVFDNYPLEKTEIAASFVSRCYMLLRTNGFVGAITNRTFLFSESFKEWRGQSLGDLDVCADLGFGVLDALVETAAYTLSSQRTDAATFIALTNSPEKELDLLQTVKSEIGTSTGSSRLIIRSRSTLSTFGTEWFYYWLSENILLTASSIEAKKAGLIAKPGLQTCDNFRFVRLAWECLPDRYFSQNWPRLSKGGDYQPFWADMHLVTNWASNGAEMKAFIETSYESWSKQIPSVGLYFSPGLTYSERTTSSLSLRVLPKGCLFDKQGPYVGFGNDATKLDNNLIYLGLSYSYIFKCLVESRVGLRDATEAGSPARHYMPSMIERLPLPSLGVSDRSEIINWVTHCIKVHKRLGALDVADSSHRGFPGLASVRSIAEYQSLVGQDISLAMQDIYSGLERVDEIVAREFRLSYAEKQELLATFGPEFKSHSDNADIDPSTLHAYLSADESELVISVSQKIGLFSGILKQSFVANRKLELASFLIGVSPIEILKIVSSFDWLINHRDLSENLIDYFIGAIFGRWDIRSSGANMRGQPEGSPFEPIPVCAPARLQDQEGMPATASAVIANCLLSSDYPISIQWDGVLAEDPNSSLDIVAQIERAIECVWPSDRSRLSHDIINELCASVQARDLRDYLRGTSGFFESHLKRHSRSRRKAPLFWPLSTSSGNYTLWVYYPSLTNQTLYTAINDFVEPKLNQVSKESASLRDKGNVRTRDDEKAFEALQSLELELIELRDTLLRIAPTYRPNHNDGVQITAAPLWQLFQHKPWQKVLKDTWTKLEKGDYDWSHLAMAYWPDRVREKCKTDKSLAIAHDLEQLYEPSTLAKGGKRKKKGGGE